MNIVGFETDKEGNLIEHLPKNEILIGDQERRSIFMYLFNYYFDKSLKFSNGEMENGKNLLEIFLNRIDRILFEPCALSYHPPKTMNMLTVHTDKAFTAYATRGHKQRAIKPDADIELASKLISMISHGDTYRLLCDVEDMFLHLVYERTIKVNRGKKVLLYEKTIIILDPRKDVAPTLIIPSYAKVNTAKPSSDPVISHHMKTVLSTLKETQIRVVYLVYPKHHNFRKHIEIKLMDRIPLRENEYRVKVMPYSFSFCTKKRKNNILNKETRDVNRNFLRK